MSKQTWQTWCKIYKNVSIYYAEHTNFLTNIKGTGMMSVASIVTAAVLASVVLQASSTPYDNYGPCDSLEIYKMPCFNLTSMCGKTFYIRYTAFQAEELTSASVTVDCFSDNVIKSTYEYSLDGHKQDTVFANLEDLEHGRISWKIKQDNVIYELEERLITLFQDAKNEDMIVSSVICTKYAKRRDIIKSVIKSTNLHLKVSNEVDTLNRFFPQCPNMVAVQNAF